MSQIAKSFLNYLENGIENMLKEINKKGALFKIQWVKIVNAELFYRLYEIKINQGFRSYE